MGDVGLSSTIAGDRALERKIKANDLATTQTVVGDSQFIIDPEQVLPYRAHLVEARQKAQEDFDKTVLSLSGGALGVSFAFIKDFIGPGPIVFPLLLMLAWAFWGASSLCVLISFYTSHLALDNAIQQIDKVQFRYRMGGGAAHATYFLNAAGGIMFFVGVVIIAAFVYFNLR